MPSQRKSSILQLIGSPTLHEVDAAAQTSARSELGLLIPQQRTCGGIGMLVWCHIQTSSKQKPPAHWPRAFFAHKVGLGLRAISEANPVKF
jgi:hypothetical protein